MKWWGSFSLLILTVTLVGCPAKKDNSEQAGSRIFFVKGDPHELIRGAALNKKSPWSITNAGELNNYSVLVVNEFVEKERVLDTGANVNLEEENKARGLTTVKKATLAVKMAEQADGQWRLSTFDGGLRIDFKPDSQGNLQPYYVQDKNRGSNVHLLHWSVSADGNYFSLLVDDLTGDAGRALVALYFEKTAPTQSIPTTDAKYIYLAGPGQKIGWRNTSPVQFTMCGSPEFTSRARAALIAWKDLLENRLDLTFTQNSRFAPFSDLNQHCIYVVDSYFQDSRTNVAMYGAAATILSPARLEIVDADVFIFQSEFRKLDALLSPTRAAILKNKNEHITLIHELGHALGLDHKFDGTPSVMSYDFDQMQPSPYDIAAIQALYELR